jgi:hypothetical protein
VKKKKEREARDTSPAARASGRPAMARQRKLDGDNASAKVKGAARASAKRGCAGLEHGLYRTKEEGEATAAGSNGLQWP